jgi:hypothetical protein
MMQSSRGSHDVTVRKRYYDEDTGEYLGTKDVTYYGTSYSNAKSAARAFNKLEKGSISGERLFARGQKYTRRGQVEGPRGRYFEMVEPPPGRYENLWKIVLWMNWDEQNKDGTIKEHRMEERSFIVHSRAHGTQYDSAIVLAEAEDAIDEHIESWEADDPGSESVGQVVGEIEIVYKDAILISYTQMGGSQVVHLP